MRARLAWSVLVVALFAAAIARLRRAERPRFETVASAAGGRVILGVVRFSRRDAAGRVVGWSVACDGHEVVARLGTDGFDTLAVDDRGLSVRDRRTAEIIRVDAAGCRVTASTHPSEGIGDPRREPAH